MDDVPRGGAARLDSVAHNDKVAGSNPAPASIKYFSKSVRSFLFYLLLPYLHITVCKLPYRMNL